MHFENSPNNQISSYGLQCPHGEDEGLDRCYADYLEKGLVTRYATYNCYSAMYPEMEIVATACNYEVECRDQADESRCSEDISRDMLLLSTLEIAVMYLIIKYSRRVYRWLVKDEKIVLFSRASKIFSDTEAAKFKIELNSMLERFEDMYEDSKVLKETNAFLFFTIFTQTKERRIMVCVRFYDVMARIHANDEGDISINMRRKLDPLIVHYISEAKYPSVLARMTNSIENCLGVKLITGLENKIIETEWLHHTLHTIKRLLSIEFKYIDLFKDTFVTIYIMMLTGGLNAVLTYPTSFTSVVVMVMATSIILPSLLSSLHLIICNPEIIYGFMGRTTANLWQKIVIFSIVLLLSVFNPIFLRYDCHIHTDTENYLRKKTI